MTFSSDSASNTDKPGGRPVGKHFRVPGWLWLAAGLVFTLGLVIRLYDLKDAPLDFSSTRQMRSVIMARGIYYEHLPSAPEWQRQLAIQQYEGEGIIEPPILENLAAATYLLVGSEKLWVIRLYSIGFWMAGGIALFLLALELTGAAGALVSLAYFLILPYGAIASRSFQPDPLMVALIIFAYWAVVRWQRTRTWSWAAAAGLLGGMAILVKSVAVFFILPVWAAVLIFIIPRELDGRRGAGKILGWLRSPQLWVIAALTILPYAAYHVYGVYIAGFLQSQFSLRFFPQLWRNPVTFLQWNGLLSSVAGFEWVLVSLAGVFLLREKVHRALLMGAWFGYFLYGMTFTFHITTHEYYHLPVIPLVALGLAGAADLAVRNLRGPRWLALAATTAILLTWVGIKAWDVRVELKRNDYTQEVVFWQKLGQKLPRGSKVIGLTHDYSYRLAYWGWVDVANWMTTADFNLRQLAGQQLDYAAMFREQTAGKDYFVVTLMNELGNQPVLKDLLVSNFAVVDQASDYIIFDLHKPVQGP